MKLLTKLSYLLACTFLLIFINCGGGSEDDPIAEDPLTKQVSDLLAAQTWRVSSVTNDGNVRDEWSDFTIKFTSNSTYTGGTYATTGIPSEDSDKLVWKTSGSWTFGSDGTSPSSIVRNDGVECALTATTTAANIAMTIADPAGRADGFYGNWVFKLVP